MSCHPAIHSKVVYGTEGEDKLLPVLSAALGKPLRKIGNSFSVLDFKGEGVFAELKKRTSEWSRQDPKIKNEGWLIPSCKILQSWAEMDKGNEVVFFYFWASDKTLWSYRLKRTDFTTGGHFVPKGHYDQMLHVAVPEHLWEQVSLDGFDLQFEEDTCWIE